MYPLSPKTIILLLIFIAFIFQTFAEYFSKVWTLKPTWGLAILIVLLYAVASIIWLPALREHGQVSALAAVWCCLSMISCAIIGVFGFQETLSIRQIIGLVLALLATFLTL